LEPGGEGFKSKEGSRAYDVIQAGSPQIVSLPPAPRGSFTPQIRMGFTEADQWEPSIASDRFGHVYIFYPQYGGVPGCPACASPTMVLQISSDHGTTWGAPAPIAPGGPQWDPQIAVDPVDGRSVYAVWMQNNKSDIIVAKSTNFGATWTRVTADSTNAATDKPIVAVRGSDVYVGYNHAQKVWVASSHDGGQTFVETNVNPNGRLGWSLAGGGAVLPNGTVAFSWAGYEQNGGAKGPVNLYASQSTNGGATWTNTLLAVSGAPPDCAAYDCGWAYLGAQVVMASSSNGALYALWNANASDKAPNRIYFAKSTDGGLTWSAKMEVSTAPNGKHHAFPAIVAVGSSDVRISWMDTRASSGLDRWNTYYRTSTNAGSSWSAETDISSSVPGYNYIFSDGFRFPFGDYYEMDVDEQGNTHVVMGEGYSYDSPGSIWYTRGP
jgi:BNR repeat protein